MFKPPPFSFEEYEIILKAISPRLKNFEEINKDEDFIILRHDVEFSVLRAHNIAKIENQNNIIATYFFQVTSSAYNPFSQNNKDLVNSIKSMGHNIGLHLYVTHIKAGDYASLLSELSRQKALFEHGFDLECRIFSYHRPPAWVLENRSNLISDMINVYGSEYFEFSREPKKIKYLADSMRAWNYGYPLDFLDEEKIQILIHPDYWAENGYSEVGFFESLIDEEKNNFIEILNQETKNFSKFKSHFK